MLGLSVALAAACAAQEDEAVATRNRCLKLRDHMVDLRVATATEVDVTKHREAMTNALGDDFVGRCQQLPAADIKCALASTDLSSAGACSSQK